MLYREMFAVCSEIHTEHINTLCGQNVELLKATISFMSLRPSVLKEQLGSHSANFHAVGYLSIFRRSVTRNFQFP